LPEGDAGEINSRARRGGHLVLTDDPREAMSSTDAVYTDVWTSMGQEAEAARRRTDLAAYQLNAALLSLAPNALVMHCLPAHRGEEITAEVLESPRSIVWQQVRHRTTAMVGVLAWLKESR
jgi:ornithine carbamoyltransferase